MNDEFVPKVNNSTCTRCCLLLDYVVQPIITDRDFSFYLEKCEGCTTA